MPIINDNTAARSGAGAAAGVLAGIATAVAVRAATRMASGGLCENTVTCEGAPTTTCDLSGAGVGRVRELAVASSTFSAPSVVLAGAESVVTQQSSLSR